MTYQRNETPEPLASATPITEAFEARYQRSAEDPTSAEMLAIFSEGWNARGTVPEALMPEPVATVDADGFLVVLGSYIPTHAKLYTADQLHEAIRAATERAAKLCEGEAVEELTDGDLAYNMGTRHCAAAIRGTT